MSIMKFFKKLRFNKNETKKFSAEKRCSGCDEWGIITEEGREVIQQWRNKRQRIKGARKSYHEFLVYSLTLDTLKSFSQNINLMVIIQMLMALTSVYIFQICEVSFNLPVPVLVSPIVFPLAFSINTDFQRREKVLEDLAVFKSSGMIWFFCMREWKEPAGLTTDWITAVHGKLKSLLFHLREYLLTYKLERRKVILRAMYEDFSDANQLIEKVRASQLPANTAIVSKSIQLLNMMCLSFERLRVIREYRSPRSIRSFNKVFIMFLPIFLAPYFLYLGIQSNNQWEPYYISALVAFVFSSLQSVQDKLDDPFGGMSEDDINLDTIDEWTFSSLEHTMQRSFDIGRFKVTVDTDNNATCDEKKRRVSSLRFAKTSSESFMSKKSFRGRCRSTTLPCNGMNSNPSSPPTDPKTAMSLKKARADFVKLAPILESVKGNARINRRSEIERPMFDDDDKEDGPAGDTRKIIGLKKIFESIVEEEDDIDEEEYVSNNADSANTDSNNATPTHEQTINDPKHYLELTTVLSDSNGDPILIRRESIDRSLYRINSSGVSNASYLTSIFSPDAPNDVIIEAPNQLVDKINLTENIATSLDRHSPINQSPVRSRSRGYSSETRRDLFESSGVDSGSKSEGNSPNINQSPFAMRRVRVNSANFRKTKVDNDSLLREVKNSLPGEVKNSLPGNVPHHNGSVNSLESLGSRLNSLQSRKTSFHSRSGSIESLTSQRSHSDSLHLNKKQQPVENLVKNPKRSRTDSGLKESLPLSNFKTSPEPSENNLSTRFIRINESENSTNMESQTSPEKQLDSITNNNANRNSPPTFDEDVGIRFKVKKMAPSHVELKSQNNKGTSNEKTKPTRFTVFSNKNILKKERNIDDNSVDDGDLVIKNASVISTENDKYNSNDGGCLSAKSATEKNNQHSLVTSIPYDDNEITVNEHHYMDMYK